MKRIVNVITLLRPQQWAKNTFVFLPLFFSGNFTNIPLLAQCILVFFIFSFAGSSIYCFNDILDVDADGVHSKKCKRPIASGAVSKQTGYLIMLLMLALSMVLIILFPFAGNKKLIVGIISLYYIMNIAYCLKLKQVALVDVFIIAVGFVLRVVIGGVATNIVLSHWIILMTFLLALFLALAKRRDDVVIFNETGIKSRKNIGRYNMEFLNQAITIIAAITLVCYIMYTVSNEVIERVHSNYLCLTSIFVLLGILRYMQLAMVDIKSGSPTKVLMNDHFTQFVLLGWIIFFVIIIYL